MTCRKSATSILVALVVLFVGILGMSTAHASSTHLQTVSFHRSSQNTFPFPTGPTNPASPLNPNHTVTHHVPGTPNSSQGAPPTAPPASPPLAPSPTKVWDSANPAGIPSWAGAVAGYVDGPYAWTPQEWAMFPHASPVTIDVVGGVTSAMVEDVEVGGVPVGDLRAWAEARLAQGYTPVVYSALSYYPAVSAALAGLHWHWWAANPVGSPNLVPGSQATQWVWNGNSFDISVVPGGVANLIH